MSYHINMPAGNDHNVVLACLGASISFTEDMYLVSESSGFLSVCVMADGVLRREIEIGLTATALTAQRGRDFSFTESDSVLVFSASTSQRCVDLEIFQDFIVEDEERLMITLTGVIDVTEILSPNEIVVIEDSSTVTLEHVSDIYNITESETAEVCVFLGGETVRDINVEIIFEQSTSGQFTFC